MRKTILCLVLLVIFLMGCSSTEPITQESEPANPIDLFSERAMIIDESKLDALSDILSQSKILIMGEFHNVQEYEELVAQLIPLLHEKGLREVVIEQGVIVGYLQHLIATGYFQLPPDIDPITLAIFSLNQKLRDENKLEDQIFISGMNFDSGFFGETFLDVFYQMGLSREISGAPEEVSAQLESGIGTGLDSATDSEFRHLVSQLMYGKDKTHVLISQEREKFMADDVKRSAELLEPGKKILVLTGARHSQKANLFESARASFKPMAELLLANFPDDIYTTFFAFYRGEVSQDGTAVDGRIGKTTFERRLLPAETDVLAKLEENYGDQTLFVNLKEHSDWLEINLSMVMKDYHADLSEYFDGMFIFPSVSVSDRFE